MEKVMNGHDIKQFEKLFEAKLKPVSDGVDDLKKDTKKLSAELIELKTKFKFVGDCSKHNANVEIVQRDVDRNSNRIWGLAIVLLVAALGICGRVLGWL